MKITKWQVIVSIILFMGVAYLSGCAFGKFGKASSNFLVVLKM